MTHHAYVNKTASGWYVWVCTCGDQAPNAFQWRIVAAFHRNNHVWGKGASREK